MAQTIRLIGCWAAALLLPLCATAATAADPIPTADFFRRPVFSGAVMSPSGRYVAATMKGGPKGRHGLVMIDVHDTSKSKGLAAFVDADVAAVHWVNDDRLVFSVVDWQSPMGDQIGQGLFTVDREGKEAARSLIRRRLAQSESYGIGSAGSRLAETGLSIFHRFHSVVRDGSNDVILVRADINDRYEVLGTTLLRLDTVKAQTTVITRGGPDFVRAWALDHRGIPRVAVSLQDGKSRLHWRVTAESPWTRAGEWDTYSNNRKTISPIVVDSANRLYVSSRQGDNVDTDMLSRLEMSTPSIEWKPLISLAGYDFEGELVFRPDGTLVGIHYLTDARGTHWLDAGLKAAQARVDQRLPGAINELDCGDCESNKVILVTSSSDRQPPAMYLFDVQSGQLSLLAQSRPWLKAQTMAHREMQRVTARDGLSIPVHITRPAGRTGQLPTIVLVHGGPYVRGGEWKWYEESQFLASRGYLVIEPEFRGSTGFGFKHFQAGWKQWGLAMQDDIADATRWAIKQGLADPKRIGIAGASYGGYAVLMGLIRYPELYQCGINWVGVSDLDLMYTARWSDLSNMWKDYGMPLLVGDREKDRQQLNETSPLKQASKLTQPLLLAYGDMDRRVPIEHGVSLRDAVTPHNKNVEWIKYADEGHGWVLEANNIDFWTKIELFLDKHLKNAK